MRRISSALFASLFVCFSAFAQSIAGKVTDPKGYPVFGVRILLSDEQNKTVATASTDIQGYYVFPGVKPGKYFLFVRESGFQQERVEVELAEGKAEQRDIVLELETLQQNVVVTATRTETSTSLLGNSVTTLSAAEIEARQSPSVAELLRSVPGFNVVQLGGRGSLTSLFVRGGESDYNKVLLDGMPLNQPGGDVDLSNLSTTNVDRIEVVRGPQSALYGSDAISSVIQIFTKKGNPEETRPEMGFLVEGGSYDSFRTGGSIAGGVGRVSYSSQFQHLSTDNREPNNFFHNNSFSSRIGIDTSKDSALSLVARVERGKSGVPGPTAFGPADLEEYYRKRDFLWGAKWNDRISDNWSQRVSYSQSYVNQLSADPVVSPSFVPTFQGKEGAFPIDDRAYSFLSATRRHNLNYQSDLVLSTHLLSAGIDYEEERGVVGDVRAARTNFGYYVQDQFILKQRIALTGGTRFEDNGSFGFAATPRISVAYLLRSGNADSFFGMTRPKFNFGLGIKEPNFVESFSTNFFFKGNPDLKPEKTRSFEAGVEQRLGRDRIRAEVNFFHNHFDDLIAFQTTDFSTFAGSFFNLAKSQAWGVEHIVEASPTDHLNLSGSYTYLHSKVLKSTDPFDPVFREGARLLLRPTHSGFVGITWLSSKWQVSTHAIFIGERADSDFLGLGLTQVDGYTKWDLSGSYRINPKLDLFAVFDNILNRDYFEGLGFPALKFNFRSGLRLRF
jgi:outer membrane cobalamin receptor